MASIKITNFTEYQLTEDEYIPAVSLTELQVMYIKNELALALQKKNLLSAEDKTPEEFIKAHEYYHGVVDTLLAILNTSEDAAELLKQQMADRSISQTED